MNSLAQSKTVFSRWILAQNRFYGRTDLKIPLVPGTALTKPPESQSRLSSMQQSLADGGSPKRGYMDYRENCLGRREYFSLCNRGTTKDKTPIFLRDPQVPNC